MPHNKTYLSNLDKERKRLTKIELSNLDSLKESINQLEEQIIDVRESTKIANNFDEIVREAVDEFVEALDNLRVLGNRLERTTDEYVKILDDAENFATTLDDLYQMKTDNVATEFAKNAVALGINPDGISEYNALIDLNDEAREKTSETYKVINQSDTIINEATRLINDNNL